MSYEDPGQDSRRHPLEYRRPPEPLPQRNVWRAVLTTLGVIILILFLGIGLLFGACMVLARR